METLAGTQITGAGVGMTITIPLAVGIGVGLAPAVELEPALGLDVGLGLGLEFRAEDESERAPGLPPPTHPGTQIASAKTPPKLTREAVVARRPISCTA
jgi:hypothetical protein